MRKNCKDSLIAEAHRNPEYASMSAKKLATVIDADQTTISAWRRRMKKTVSMYKTNITKNDMKDPLIAAYAKSKSIDWETLAKKLQAALSAQIKETDGLEKLIAAHQQRIYELESRTWFQRVFNLKG